MYRRNFIYVNQSTINIIFCLRYIPYSRKLSSEKTFTNFAVLEPPVKVFSTKFGCAVPSYDRFWHSAKVFSAKWSLLIYRSARVFSLESFPLYGIHVYMPLERSQSIAP